MQSLEKLYLPNPSARAWCDTRLILARSTVDLKSIFLFIDRLPYQDK